MCVMSDSVIDCIKNKPIMSTSVDDWVNNNESTESLMFTLPSKFII